MYNPPEFGDGQDKLFTLEIDHPDLGVNVLTIEVEREYKEIMNEETGRTFGAWVVDNDGDASFHTTWSDQDDLIIRKHGVISGSFTQLLIELEDFGFTKEQVEEVIEKAEEQ